MILGAIDRIYQFFEYKDFSDKQLDQRQEIDKTKLNSLINKYQINNNKIKV